VTKRPKKRGTDPRKLPGAMVGPGGPHDHGGVILDARNAVMLDSIDVSTLDPERGGRGQSLIALILGGRINQTTERAGVLFVMGTEGAASIVAELYGLYGRATGDIALFSDMVAEKLRVLGEEGNLT
jgi:hypothetical protein